MANLILTFEKLLNRNRRYCTVIVYGYVPFKFVQNFEIFYPNNPWICSKLKFVQMVVLLALLAKILADIVETLRVEYQNIKNLLLRKK